MRFLQLSVVTKILILKNVHRFSLIDSSLDTSLTKLRDSNRHPLFAHRFTLRKVKLPAKERNNSQHCWANKVVSCCVRVGSGVQRDATAPTKTMLGPAVYRREKDTDHKTSMRVRALTMLEELCITDPTLLGYASAITQQKKFWELLAQKFYWCQTLRNNSQQHATTCNRVCKRTQHMTTNNVASVCKGLIK